jgi:branched-chain amino acid transport system permease protein
VRSRIGRAMVAVRDNETAAAVMGVNLFSVKTVVFGLSGAIAGVAGSLYGLKLTLVEADVPLFGLFGSVTLLVAMVVGGAAQNWGPFVGAMFYVFVNDFARTVGEEPSESLLLGWLVDEGTKVNGLGGVTFGVLLILFARFVPFGAVGTAKIWRSKVVQVIPRIPVAMAGSKGSVTPQVSMTTVDSAGTSPDAGDESAP